MLYEKNENIVRRTVYKSYFLIDICKNFTDDVFDMIEINEIGNFIWNVLDNIHDKEQIAASLLKEINGDVEYDEVYSDVSDFIDMLVSKSCLREVENNE